MQKLTCSCYSFEQLVEDHFLYVDKTEYIWKLISQGIGHYFLARPRRFGKSLTLSTLKAVFEGKKELFQGLAIFDKPYDWKPYPVIHLDLGNCDAQTPEALRHFIACMLNKVCLEHHVHVDINAQQLAFSLEEVICTIAGTGQVVILLDEYDKPILNTLTTPYAEECLRILKGFYSTIKTCNSRERFVFVTGVSKIILASFFSDLNNLRDISMVSGYATMLGYTQEELESAFAEHIEQATQTLAISRKQLLTELEYWYDGYRFEEDAKTVYNPVSIANFFADGAEFKNYWFTTGTPTFLMELIKQRKFQLEGTLKRPVAAETFGNFEISRLDPLPLLFQTGYLTIASVETNYNRTRYHLDFPNFEVSNSFNEQLIAHITGKSDNDTINFCDLLFDAVNTCDMELMHMALKTFFAGISYDIHHYSEANFQNIFFAVFRILGYRVKAEVRTNAGRVDAVCETDSWVYLFEFKLDNDPTALEQIYRKEYFAPYLLLRKRIMLVGVNFDTGNGQLSQWQCEEFPGDTTEETHICKN